MDSSSTSTDGLLKFLAWLDKNKKRVSLIATGTAVAGALIAAIVYYQSQKESRASEALSNVRRPFNPSTALPAGTAEAYLKVARDYDGTKAAGRALLEAGSVYYTEGNYPNAETQYKRFLSEYPDSPFLPQGLLGLASTLDAEGKAADAIAKYEELRRRFPSDSVIDEAKLGLARLYEKQNPAEAYKLYSELVSAGSQTGVGSEAGIRREDLLEKHPDLGQTNVPPAAVVAPVTPAPQVSMARPVTTNPVIMTITNTSRTSPASSTGAPPASPLVIPPTSGKP